jgi:hypothetical protein
MIKQNIDPEVYAAIIKVERIEIRVLYKAFTTTASAFKKTISKLRNWCVRIVNDFVSDYHYSYA